MNFLKLNQFIKEQGLPPVSIYSQHYSISRFYVEFYVESDSGLQWRCWCCSGKELSVKYLECVESQAVLVGSKDIPVLFQEGTDPVESLKSNRFHNLMHQHLLMVHEIPSFCN